MAQSKEIGNVPIDDLLDAVALDAGDGASGPERVCSLIATLKKEGIEIVGSVPDTDGALIEATGIDLRDAELIRIAMRRLERQRRRETEGSGSDAPDSTAVGEARRAYLYILRKLCVDHDADRMGELYASLVGGVVAEGASEEATSAFVAELTRVIDALIYLETQD